MVDWKKSFQYEGIHWWRNVFGIPYYFKERRYLLKHGFTREAEYDMPLWFIKTMTRVMTRYSDTRWGIRGGYTDKEWQAVVDKMIECLKNMRASEWFEKAPEEMSLLERDMWAQNMADKYKNDFFDLFKEVFYLLWD